MSTIERKKQGKKIDDVQGKDISSFFVDNQRKKHLQISRRNEK